MNVTDAIRQAELVRGGEVSAGELVEAMIRRVERLDPAYNAVIHRRFERALAEAGTAPDGPFRGVPILIKDLGQHSAGDPMTMGSRCLFGYRAAKDGFLVARLRRAGFIIIGRTNTPEFGSDVTTEPAAYGPSRNPWNPEFSAGGSSGGSAAAVSSGMVAIATASDGGGSIRIPSSLCGLVGLKPTRGRISQGPQLAEGWAGLSVPGVLTQTVRDTAAVLDVLSGREPGDPYDAPPLPGPLIDEVGRDPGRLRIGYVTVPPRGDVPEEPVCREAVAQAVRLLEKLGHDVAPGHPAALADPEFPGFCGSIVCSAVAAEVDEIGRMRGRPVEEDELELRNQVMAKVGRRNTAPGHLTALKWMGDFRFRMAPWFEAHDVLVTPTIGVAPYRLGWLPADDIGTAQERTAQVISLTSVFNATGQPAISLPLHRTEEGMPVGVQLVAGFGREDLLVRLAAQLENAAGPFPAPQVD